MSTQQTDAKGPEKPAAPIPGSFHTQDTQEEKVVAAQPFSPPPPQAPLAAPPQPPPSRRVNRWYIIIAVGVAFLLLLSLGTLLAVQLSRPPVGPGAGTPTATIPTAPPATAVPTPGSDVTPTPAPGVILGPQTCPAGVGDPARWNTIIGTGNGERRVEGVSCANILGNTTLQALVKVRHNNAEATLDVYVFDKITSDQPTRIFRLSGLIKGDAKISGYNTVMTAQVDKNSSLNAGKAFSAMTPDLFREFQWSAEKKTLEQVAFPGIFPDLTRYQAEADQARIDKGQDTWKNDPAKVAQAMAAKFFDWQRPTTAQILSGGGPRDVYATVKVTETPPQGVRAEFAPSVKVTLSRLEGKTHNFWVVIGTTDNTMLSNIAPRSLITSPVTLEGKGAAFEAVVGRAVVYDHLYSDIGHAQIVGDVGMGIANYSTKVVYTSTFRAGAQEGVVAAYAANGGISDEIFGGTIVKVLLNPEPGVALGELPCPDALKDPAHWTPLVSIPPNPVEAERVMCGNLLGLPSLQAMVIAREIVGGGPIFRSVFIFDNISDPHPKLLFKVTHLLHGDARISSYSTIMTAEVNSHSPLNEGKPDADMTVDLFREFNWSEGTETFVQVAFPGLFPDLTRYQAEMDQRMVNNGQDPWKNDPAKVAQALTAKFFDWKRPTTTKILSGGGARDVDAVVLVKETAPQGAQSSYAPFVRVTLSRLGGNTHNIWVVVKVEDDHLLTLTNIPARSLVSSPVTLKGKGAAFEAVIGRAVVYDHLYNDIGHARITGSPGMGIADYSTSVQYRSTYGAGAQEGIIAVYEANGGLSEEIYTAVMVKVLLAQQR